MPQNEKPSPCDHQSEFVNVSGVNNVLQAGLKSDPVQFSGAQSTV